SASRAIGEGTAQAVSFGRAFIANPDLVERLNNGYALNSIDERTLYQGGQKGYIDYPFVETINSESTD
ncbi:MAG: alkene reductase, partial [Cellvibrionales bacterium]|nr:alkene reductase [Cellvibrionales bacterium]